MSEQLVTKERVEEIKKLKEDFSILGKFVVYPCDVVNDLIDYIDQQQEEIERLKSSLELNEENKEEKKYYLYIQKDAEIILDLIFSELRKLR